VLASLEAQSHTRAQNLERLKSQQAGLEKLLRELRAALERFPVEGNDAFTRLRGKLAWPVSGHLVARYGESRAGGVGIRVDSAVYQGYSIPPYYDSLIGKLIERRGPPQTLLLPPAPDGQRHIGSAHQHTERPGAQRARFADVGFVRKHVDLLEVAVSNRNAATLGPRCMRLTSRVKRWVSVAWKRSRWACYTTETIRQPVGNRPRRPGG